MSQPQATASDGTPKQAELLLNAGKPCGDSFIDPDENCRAGEALDYKAMKAKAPELAVAAQKVYDAWEQDAEGMDEELGEGGICQDVAEEMAGVLAAAGFEAGSVSQTVGDQHVFVVAKATDGVYLVDIPPHVYESGSGYTWKKKPGVKIEAGDVLFERIDKDPEKFEQYLENSAVAQEKIANKGKKCGDSHIASEKECHVGAGEDLESMRSDVKRLEAAIRDEASYLEYDKARQTLKRSEQVARYGSTALTWDEQDAALEPLEKLNEGIDQSSGGNWQKGEKIRDDKDLGGVFKTSGTGVLFRGVTLEDWSRIQAQGFLDTDGRGVITKGEEINLTQHTRTAVGYIPSGKRGVVLAIKPDEDSLFRIGADDYIRARGRIPVDRIVATSPEFIKGESGETYLATTSSGRGRLANSGKPCGDSYIHDGFECRVGVESSSFDTFRAAVAMDLFSGTDSDSELFRASGMIRTDKAEAIMRKTASELAKTAGVTPVEAQRWITTEVGSVIPNYTDGLLQRAAVEMFGATLTTKQENAFESVKRQRGMTATRHNDRLLSPGEQAMTIGAGGDVPRRAVVMQTEAEALSDAKSVLQTVYNQTQSRLRGAGIKALDLYYVSHGPTGMKDGESADYDFPAMGTFTVDKDEAFSRASGRGSDVLKIAMPADRIVSTPRDGFGLLELSEVVAHNRGPVKATKLATHKPFQPLRNSLPQLRDRLFNSGETKTAKLMAKIRNRAKA